MTNYERYKARVEIATRLGWHVREMANTSGSLCWFPPGSPEEPRYAVKLPSLEDLQRAELRTNGKKARGDGMIAQHTPGPWKAMLGTEFDTERWTIAQDGPIPFIIFEGQNGAPGDTIETEAANARLIAAAPELLAACHELLDNLQRDSGSIGSPHADYALELGRAAIAKAEGGES